MKDTNESLKGTGKAKAEKIEEEWDKTRVIIGVIFLILLIVGGFVGKKYILGLFGIQNTQPVTTSMIPGVKGASTINLPTPQDQTAPHATYSLPSASDVTDKIQELQQQAAHVNIADLSSASPQIQQVIQQLQALPQLPASVAKQQCLQICSKL